MHIASERLFNICARSSGFAPGASISDRRLYNLTIVDLSGPLTRKFAVQVFHDRVRELLQEGAWRFAINLDYLPDMGSSGFCALAAVYTWLERTGGQIKLFAASEQVRCTLHRLRFGKVFEIFEDEEAALRALSPPRSRKNGVALRRLKKGHGSRGAV